MSDEQTRQRWPAGVSAADFPIQAQKWAERHANDPSGPEIYPDELPALAELARLTSWRQSLRDVSRLARRIFWTFMHGRS